MKQLIGHIMHEEILTRGALVKIVKVIIVFFVELSFFILKLQKSVNFGIDLLLIFDRNKFVCF